MLIQSDHPLPPLGLAAAIGVSSFSIEPLGGFATFFK
jgi:hypothetical protein